jgi:hypothetical protein
MRGNKPRELSAVPTGLDLERAAVLTQALKPSKALKEGIEGTDEIITSSLALAGARPSMVSGK